MHRRTVRRSRGRRRRPDRTSRDAFVVQPHKHHERARLVPVERASAAGDGIALDCSVADVEALDPVHESAYLRGGGVPRRRSDWRSAPKDVLALPVYQEMDGMGTVIDPDAHVNRQLRPHSQARGRGPPVELGRVRGTATTSATSTASWSAPGRSPTSCSSAATSGAIARSSSPRRRSPSVENDRVTLSLTKDAVGLLESRRVHRWFSDRSIDRDRRVRLRRSGVGRREHRPGRPW